MSVTSCNWLDPAFGSKVKTYLWPRKTANRFLLPEENLLLCKIVNQIDSNHLALTYAQRSVEAVAEDQNTSGFPVEAELNQTLDAVSIESLFLVPEFHCAIYVCMLLFRNTRL